MTLAEISIRKPVFAWMLMLALLLLGGISFGRLGISQLPDVDSPSVSISVTWDGAAPEVIELNVVEPIEEAMTQIQGVKSIDSSSRSGRASISVEFGLDKKIDVAVQEIQTALGQVQRQLPKDIEPPIVRKSNPEDQPILWLAVLSDRMTPRELMAYVREHVKDRFSTIEGVGEIQLGGFVDPALRVDLSAKRLKEYQLTASDIVSAIQAEHVEMPSGRIEMADKEINIRTLGEATTPEEFGKLSINRRGGSPNFVPLKLAEVADISEGLMDVRRKSRSMGKTSVGLGIKKQRGSNAVEVAQSVKKRLKEMSATLPPGMEMAVNFDATKFIEEAVHELNFSLVLSAVLTAIVCWLFLGSWSATFNVILSIPVSVVGTFIALYALGFTLNTFTLLGLSLAIGIVVDDAIMVLENIVRHREQGKSREDAALVGAREITFAAMAATVAVIAIFLPVAFMEGLIGKYFYQFGVTISVAVGLSLLEALTFAPMRCAQFLDTGHRSTRIGRAVEKLFHSSERFYANVLAACLRHRWKTVGVAFAVFALSCVSLKFIPMEFVPTQDQSSLMLRVQTPIGSSLDFTDKKLLEIEEILSKQPEIERYFGSIGGFGGGEVDTAVVFITLKQPKERPVDPKLKKRLTQQQFSDRLRAQLKDVKQARAFLMDFSRGGFGGRRGFPVEFTIRGPEWEKLAESAKLLMAEMEKTELVVDVDSDYRTGMPELHVIPDREKAQRRGVSLSEINQTISLMVGGADATKYSRGNFRYYVRIRLKPEERNTAASLNALLVRNNRGELIPLSEVVTMKEGEALQTISHEDRERAISVHANLVTGVAQQATIERISEIAKKVLPQGYRAVVGGSAETFGESMRELLFALLLGIAVAYMVLGSQFNSFIGPFVVLLALPFSLSGALVGLLVSGHSLNIFSMIGIILLMGIVKKNSIILVDFTNQLRDGGLEIDRAIQEACPLRLRPILMTTVSTIAGAIPPALAIGPGAESRVPMAIAVIGGVLVSTILTLVVVPCAYSLVSFTKKKKYGDNSDREPSLIARR